MGNYYDHFLIQLKDLISISYLERVGYEKKHFYRYYWNRRHQGIMPVERLFHNINVENIFIFIDANGQRGDSYSQDRWV